MALLVSAHAGVVGHHTAEEGAATAPSAPPREEGLRRAGRAIADSSPYDNPLASLILEAEQLYLKARCSPFAVHWLLA
ncbi:hypothetical protein [Streptomyces sp. NPDC001401]|uniref:hypothetical protein n=1 Tax=Streptomyces sp. NPDC001401 TaxID=3364570 RepID=UPI003673BFB0